MYGVWPGSVHSLSTSWRPKPDTAGSASALSTQRHCQISQRPAPLSLAPVLAAKEACGVTLARQRDPVQWLPRVWSDARYGAELLVCNGDIIYADNAIEPVATTPWNKDTEHVVGEGMAVANDLDGFRARYRYHLADPKLRRSTQRRPCPTRGTTMRSSMIGVRSSSPRSKAQLLEDGQRAWFEYHPHTGPPEEPRRIYRTVRWGAHVEALRSRLPLDAPATSCAQASRRVMRGSDPADEDDPRCDAI